MFGSMKLKIGSLFGIGIYVHWTFLLLPLWAIFFSSGGPFGIGFFLLLLIGMFTCVVMHEYGHALMARYFGIGTRDITLYPIGGVARLEKMSEKPHEELLIAVAGPAVNVVIVTILIPIIFILGLRLEGGAAYESYICVLCAMNVGLVLFNMIPAFPMDGGRVFRAIVSMLFGEPIATRIAVYVGVVVIVFVVLGFMGAQYFILKTTPQPFILVLAVFVLFAGQQELRMVEHRHRMRNADGPPIVVKARPVYQSRSNDVFDPFADPYAPQDRYYDSSEDRHYDTQEDRRYEQPQAPPQRPYEPSTPKAFDASGMGMQPSIAVYVWDSANNAWVRDKKDDA